MDTLTGQQLGQYELIELIGRGGMGTVYRAMQSSIGREVAVKVLPRTLIEQNSGFLDRFTREVQVVAQLQHPHIIPIYDYGEQDGIPYVVMSYIGAGSLSDHVRSKGPMPLTDVVRIVSQIAHALDFAHSRGIVHRDVKPANILFDEAGNAYLADFGLAKIRGGTQITATDTMIGTPDYMAPDWSHTGEAQPSVDVYALGVVAYQMLAGEVPYKSSTPMGVLMAHLAQPIPDIREARPDLSPAVAAVLKHALAKTSESRYPSGGEFAAALEAASQRGVSGYVEPPSGVEQQYYMPNAIAHLAMKAVAHVMGQEEMEAVLIHAGLMEYIDNPAPDNLKREIPFSVSGRFYQSLYRIYGKRGSQTIGRLVGRYQFELATQKFKGMIKINQAIMKAAPENLRVRVALETVSRSFAAMSDMRAEADEDERYWILRMTRCYACYGWQAEEPVCFTMLGMLHVLMDFISGGHYLPRIVEAECMAMGHPACLFLIEKVSHDSAIER